MAQPRPEDALQYLNNYNSKGTKQTPGGKPSLKGKNLVKAVGLLAFVALILMLIFNLIFSTPDLQNELISLSAKQQDIQRWAQTGTESARTDVILNQSATINQFMQSDNKTLNSYITKKYGIKDISKLVKAKQDIKVDAKLKTAIGGNRFDDEFRVTVGDKVSLYKQQLRELNSKADTNTLKTHLSEAYAHIEAVKLQ